METKSEVTTNLSLVKKKEVRMVLEKFGIEISEDKKSGEEVMFLTEKDIIEDNFVRCKCCREIVNTQNFGHLISNPKIVYCNSQSCFEDYLKNKSIGGKMSYEKEKYNLEIIETITSLNSAIQKAGGEIWGIDIKNMSAVDLIDILAKNKIRFIYAEEEFLDYE
jgi:hypothetical protein